MIRPHLQRHRRAPAEADGATQISTGEIAVMFATPQWMQDLGLRAWFLAPAGG